MVIIDKKKVFVPYQIIVHLYILIIVVMVIVLMMLMNVKQHILMDLKHVNMMEDVINLKKEKFVMMKNIVNL